MCERILLERDNPTTSQIDCGAVGFRSSTQPTDPKSPRLPVPQSPSQQPFYLSQVKQKQAPAERSRSNQI